MFSDATVALKHDLSVYHIQSLRYTDVIRLLQNSTGNREIYKALSSNCAL